MRELINRYLRRCARCGEPIRIGQRVLWGKGKPACHITGECPVGRRPGLLRLRDD